MTDSKILFICYGNIARSQMAEGFYNHFTSSKDAISAGTSFRTPVEYTKPLSEAIAVMKEIDIDISQYKVKQVSQEMVNFANKIYVLTKKDDCPSYILNSDKTTFWDIDDPFNSSIEKFRQVRDLIRSKVKSILN